MPKKVKVTSIQIQYPDGEVKQVSIEDARELYKQLDDLFGDPKLPQYQPIIIERERWPRWSKTSYVIGPNPPRPQVWCCTE